VTPEWQQKLPDFVKRLEEALYKNAACKVCDFDTAIWVLPTTVIIGFSMHLITNYSQLMRFFRI